MFQTTNRLNIFIYSTSGHLAAAKWTWTIYIYIVFLREKPNIAETHKRKEAEKWGSREAEKQRSRDKQKNRKAEKQRNKQKSGEREIQNLHQKKKITQNNPIYIYIYIHISLENIT